MARPSASLAAATQGSRETPSPGSVTVSAAGLSLAHHCQVCFLGGSNLEAHRMPSSWHCEHHGRLLCSGGAVSFQTAFWH